jgi:NAD(P)-dependent dehydrogenase (short-subunit alcohol dehydrogenase family)
LETALCLAERGYRVYATVRSLSSQAAVLAEAERRRVALEVVELDVTDRASIDSAVSTVTARSGAIFGLVNNAGIGLRGCLEDLSEDEIRMVYEVNVFGTMAVTQRALAAMRASGRGRIVTISSVGGRIGTFGLSAYCSTKFALEGFAESLAVEIAPFGLRSILIEPGIINTTRWTVNRGLAREACNPKSPYHAMFSRHEAIAGRIARRSRTKPVDVAKAVEHALTVEHPQMRYVVGRPAAAVVALRRYVPSSLFERLYFGSLLRRISHDASVS